MLQRGAVPKAITAIVPLFDAEDVEDLDDAPESEIEAADAEILDQATAAQTIDEFKAEIDTLKRLEGLAQTVRRSGAESDLRLAPNHLAALDPRKGRSAGDESALKPQ